MDFGPPPGADPSVIVEITAPDDAEDAAGRLVATLRTRLPQRLPMAPADIDVRLVRASR